MPAWHPALSHYRIIYTRPHSPAPVRPLLAFLTPAACLAWTLRPESCDDCGAADAAVVAEVVGELVSRTAQGMPLLSVSDVVQ
jgi:hypothetical protein